MKDDSKLVAALSAGLRGVFSAHDLETALAERHPSRRRLRIDALVRGGVLRRFVRGWYVTQDVDLEVLSQRLNPGAYTSLTTVLATERVIGTMPSNLVVAVKTGHIREYSGAGYRITHLGVQPHLHFGWYEVDGVRRAFPEKALLDVLHFHLHGRRFPFDIYSDINWHRLDLNQFSQFLGRFKNKKFVAFATGLANESSR